MGLSVRGRLGDRSIEALDYFTIAYRTDPERYKALQVSVRAEAAREVRGGM